MSFDLPGLHVPECCICQIGYDSDEHSPMVLQCGHSLCHTCVLQINLSTEQCPLCREPLQYYVKNYQLEECVQMFNTGIINSIVQKKRLFDKNEESLKLKEELKKANEEVARMNVEKEQLEQKLEQYQSDVTFEHRVIEAFAMVAANQETVNYDAVHEKVRKLIESTNSPPTSETARIIEKLKKDYIRSLGRQMIFTNVNGEVYPLPNDSEHKLLYYMKKMSYKQLLTNTYRGVYDRERTVRFNSALKQMQNGTCGLQSC